MNEGSAAVVLRPAREDDLDQVAQIWYLDEVQDAAEPASEAPGGAMYVHHLRHGELWVAEREGRILGFACGDVRGDVRFLSDLFVRPESQGAGLGRALLERALPDDGRRHATLSSKDPRAQALYARRRMAPRWPHFSLRAGSAGLRLPGGVGIQVIVADSQDRREIEAMDAAVGGRPRAVDHARWLETLEATPLLFERSGRRLGYGFARRAAPHGSTEAGGGHLGPIGVDEADRTGECALAAVRWAADRYPTVDIGLPGPHPALRPLLEAGFRIVYVELFMGEEFADGRRYVPSDSDLF